MSTWNIRLRSDAQSMREVPSLGGGLFSATSGFVASSSFGQPLTALAGTTSGRSFEPGANTPWYLTRLTRGGGMSTASFSTSSSPVITSETYGQSPEDAQKDANDLQGSAKRDLKAIQDSGKLDEACAQAYKNAARKIAKITNRQYTHWLKKCLTAVELQLRYSCSLNQRRTSNG